MICCISKSASGAKQTKYGRRPFGQKWTLPSQPPPRYPSGRAPIPLSDHAATGAHSKSSNSPSVVGNGESARTSSSVTSGITSPTGGVIMTTSDGVFDSGRCHICSHRIIQAIRNYRRQRQRRQINRQSPELQGDQLGSSLVNVNRDPGGGGMMGADGRRIRRHTPPPPKRFLHTNSQHRDTTGKRYSTWTRQSL